MKLDWLGNNPKLNSIKNLQAKIKNLVAEKQLTSRKALINTTKEVWM